MDDKKGCSTLLADVLASVSNLGADAQGREQIEYIDIDHLHPDERNFYALDGIEELAANIEFTGLQQPIRVRPDPEHEGEYIISSGHRRHAALRQLVDSGDEKFRLVPSIVERDAGADGEAASLLQELRLICANSDTRKMSSADVAKQAERVEMLLYQLKEAGVEFTGRMRDHVAEACKVSKSKLGRLKVIRENLIKELKKDWEKGVINESVAYMFAKQPAESQRLMISQITKYGKSNTERKWWREWEAKYAAETVARELKPHKGPKGTCERCEATDRRLHRQAMNHQWDDHCADGKCCHDCPNIGTCEYACLRLANEVAKAKAAAQAEQAAEKKKKQKENEKLVAPTVRLWKRFGEARAAAGLTFEEYAKKADARGFIREKKVVDFEQGRKITPSSGGLPYAGGNGVDEWRIRPLIRAADALGVSLDYLLCRTDDPNPVPTSGTAPTWQTGTPPASGYYYAKINCSGKTLCRVVYWDQPVEMWKHRVDATSVDAEVLAWFPLPPTDEEAADGK